MYFSMINGDPEFELLCEIDQLRFVKFIMLEIQNKKPTPIDPIYLTRKGFDLKKRPISLTLQMLHNFIDLVTQDCVSVYPREEKIREEKRREEESALVSEKVKFQDYVFLKTDEFEKVVSDYGSGVAKDYIGRLNSYIGQIGEKKAKTKYTSHFHTLLNWIKRDNIKMKPKEELIKNHKPDPEQQEAVSKLMQHTLANFK